jgi:hypothetical protein
VFFYVVIYVISQNINIISIGQKLMCPIQFQSFLFLLDPPDDILAMVIKHPLVLGHSEQ